MQRWSELGVVFLANGDTLNRYLGNKPKRSVKKIHQKKLDIFSEAWGNAFESNLRIGRDELSNPMIPGNRSECMVAIAPSRES